MSIEGCASVYLTPLSALRFRKIVLAEGRATRCGNAKVSVLSRKRYEARDLRLDLKPGAHVDSPVSGSL